MTYSIRQLVEKNHKDREKNNDKRKVLRKKLGLSGHTGGKKQIRILLQKLRKREVNIKDALNFIIRERADADYQGEIRGLIKAILIFEKK